MSAPPGIPPALQSRAADRPPQQERWGAGATLSAVAHVALVAGLAWSVHWKTETSEAVEAELWSAVPQAAAPPPTTTETPPTPVPPPPEPRPAPTPPPPPPPAPTPPAPRPPDIVTERDAKARERERVREERERQEELQKEQKQKQLRDEQQKREQQQQQQDKLDKQKALDQKKADEARLKKQHDENVARMLGGIDAPATATGTARKSAGPSAGYGAKVRAVIHPFIRPLNEYPGNPKADILVTLAPDGTIAASRLDKSSGDRAWDEEALKSIERARSAGVHIPRDIDGSLPNPQIMTIDPGS